MKCKMPLPYITNSIDGYYYFFLKGVFLEGAAVFSNSITGTGPVAPSKRWRTSGRFRFLLRGRREDDTGGAGRGVRTAVGAVQSEVVFGGFTYYDTRKKTRY